MNRFTLAILRSRLRDPDTKATVCEWLDAEPERERRAVGIAAALREDILKGLIRESENRIRSNDRLLDELLYEALMSVNWRRGADELLDRFSPKLLAGYLSTPSVN